VHEAQKSFIELVIASRYPTKDLHALEKIFNQVARLVALLVPCTLLFAVPFTGEDDLHSLLWSALNNLV
jgi:hypothetical protein